MKKNIWLVLVLSGTSFSIAARAESIDLQPFILAEAFLPMNSGKGLENDALAGASQLNGAGYSTLTTVQTRTAIGFRGGVKGELSDSFDLGVSGGYILGPNSDVTITANAGALSGILTDKREIRFVRFLVEPSFKAELSDTKYFHLGAGLGVARGSVEETFACTGNACLASSAKTASNWTGFTWEISPYFTTGHATYGFRYAGFPSFSGNSNNSKIDWSTFAFFAGIVF
ncbi:MAG: hypothetical protein HYZ74_06045 [Elusimicrobia bacterium]|nr:hypothetical protein [Elusimicrobiota bacterium]